MFTMLVDTNELRHASCTWYHTLAVGYVKDRADTRPPRAPMGGEQLLQHRVGSCDLDAPFFPGETELPGYTLERYPYSTYLMVDTTP